MYWIYIIVKILTIEIFAVCLGGNVRVLLDTWCALSRPVRFLLRYMDSAKQRGAEPALWRLYRLVSNTSDIRLGE